MSAMDTPASISTAVRVFISYSRSDLTHAIAVVAALRECGLVVAMDQSDLDHGERWKVQLQQMIRAADVVVFLVSPRSVASHWCRWELAHVTEMSKKLVPATVEPKDFLLLLCF